MLGDSPYVAAREWGPGADVTLGSWLSSWHERNAIVAIAYLTVALFGSILFAVLTPPFQVPDEHQHFFHAYQIAAGGKIERSGRALGATLPDSLGALADEFLGSRKVYVERRDPRPVAHGEIAAAFRMPMRPEARRFLDFTGAAPYPTWPYLPQVCAIAVGRGLGVGPVGLVYAARLMNAVVACSLMALAILWFPYRRLMLAAVGLTPMALAMFGSVSPDALLIASTTLLASFTLRWAEAGTLGGWRFWGLAALGAAVCAFKPVYAPILLLGFPTSLRRMGLARAIVLHGGLMAIAALAAVAWYAWLAPPIHVVVPSADQVRQTAGLVAKPFKWIAMVGNTWHLFGTQLAFQFVGIFGWLNVFMPPVAYLLALTALIAGAAVEEAAPGPSVADASWALLLFAGVFCLSATLLYLTWTRVGADHAEGLQGRYFLPAAGLLAVALPGIAGTLLRLPRLTSWVVVAAAIVPIGLGLVAIHQAYGVGS
jgi:hypothetical protein